MTPVKIVRGIIVSAGCFAAMAIVGGMSILNYRFASKLSDDSIDKVVYGLMAVAVVVVGTIIWLMIEAAWSHKRRATAAFLGIAGVVFAGWALTMSAGHIGSNRITAGNTAHYGANRSAAFQNNEKALQAELVALGSYRDSGRIKSEIQIMQDSFTWVQTDKCKIQNSSKQKRFCKAYAQAQGELSTATKADELKGRLQVVQDQIAAFGAEKVGDGQAKVLNGLLHWASTSNADDATSEEAVSQVLSLAQAVVSLFAELTIVRIMILLFGWKPEDLVGGFSGAMRQVVSPMGLTETQPGSVVVVDDSRFTKWREGVLASIEANPDVAARFQT